MNVRMDAARTIYAAVDALLSLVAPDKAILTTVEVCVTSKTDLKASKSRDIHFLFERPRGTYIAVYWASPEKRGFPSQISIWTRSANNDGVQVVGGQGIGGPLYRIAVELSGQLGGDQQDYEAEASWLLGQPEPVKLKKVTKFSKEQFDFRYKVQIEE